MPERERISTADPCELAVRWLVDVDVMLKVHAAAVAFEAAGGRDLYIISGFRTQEEQDRLREEGRPAADDDLSTHRTCPATGVDVSMGIFPSRVLKATWGRSAVEQGLRWGGGSPVDDGGIPSDWGHVDAGPRSR